jgi:hypothetical protein
MSRNKREGWYGGRLSLHHEVGQYFITKKWEKIKHLKTVHYRTDKDVSLSRESRRFK